MILAELGAATTYVCREQLPLCAWHDRVLRWSAGLGSWQHGWHAHPTDPRMLPDPGVAPEDTTHCVFLQDDLLLMPRFLEVLTALVTARPDDAIGLLHVRPQAARLQAEGYRWFASMPYIMGPGYVLPRPLLREYYAWRNGQTWLTINGHSDASLLNEFLFRTGRSSLHPIPSPCVHDRSIVPTAIVPPASSQTTTPSTWSAQASSAGDVSALDAMTDPDYWRTASIPRFSPVDDLRENDRLDMPGAELPADEGMEWPRHIRSSVTWSPVGPGPFTCSGGGGLTCATGDAPLAAPLPPASGPAAAPPSPRANRPAAARLRPTNGPAAGWTKIPGWFDFDDIYQQAVDDAQDGAVMVEVGTALGRSLAFLVQAIQRSAKKIHVYSVDAWPDTLPEGWGSEHYPLVKSLCGDRGPEVAFRKLMDRHCDGWERYVTVWAMTSEEGAKRFGELDVKADLVFVDANHTYPFVKQDIAMWRPYVKPGAVMAGHDHTTEFPGVVQAVAEAFPGRTIRRTSWWIRL
jgi:Methyltransferase domain